MKRFSTKKIRHIKRSAPVTFALSTLCLVALSDAAWAGLGGGGGDTHTWTGNVSTSWHNSGNWNTAQVPGAGDSAIILGGSNNVVLFANTASIESLFIGGARTVSNNGHVLNVVSGAGTTTVTGLGSSLIISPTVAPFGLATHALSIQSNAILNMDGGWILTGELDLLGGADIIGDGWIDIDSPSLSAFNGLNGGELTVAGGDLHIRIFGGGSMALPDTINILEAAHGLYLVGGMASPIQDVNLGSDTTLNVDENWTLAGSLHADTAFDEISTISGNGSMEVEGDLIVTASSHLRVDSTIRFENTSVLTIGSNATLEVDDWFDADAGHSTTIALNGRLLLDGPMLASQWDGNISSMGGNVEVNSVNNMLMNGDLSLGSVFAVRSTVAGSHSLRAFGDVNVTGIGAIVDGALDIEATADMTLGSSALLLVNGDLALSTGSSTSGIGAIEVNPGGELFVEDAANVGVDVINEGDFHAGTLSSLSTAEISGPFTQTATGRLMVALAGHLDQEKDLFVFSDGATLAGTLHVMLTNGFVPNVGDEFEVLSATDIDGTFDALSGAPGFSIAYTPNSVVLTYEGVAIVGDVNGDGFVNIDDLFEVVAAWGSCPALPAPCPADVNLDGQVNVDDLFLVVTNWT